MSRDSIGNILRVSVLLCLVCALGVSTAAVGLQDRQEENKRLDQQKNILLATGNYKPDELGSKQVQDAFKNVERKWVDLATGTLVLETSLPGGADYDARAAAADTQLKYTIPPELNITGIGTRAKFYPVYYVKKDGKLDTIVLPIVGKGLWSTMYGFLAMEPDLKTIRGIKYYEEGETPGLGGEVNNPLWMKQWKGKVAFKDGEPAIDVVKGSVSDSDPNAKYKIDGLAGATITSNGVEHTVDYWLGKDGFGPFIEKQRSKVKG